MSTHPDPAFPALHGRPPAGWLNDPNGVGRIDGRWHVFFQHNPHGPTHHEIAWGHASSPDLAHWDAEPIALVARPGELDRHGCWTGCLVDDGGVPTAVYSAVADTSGASAVLLARSDRTLRSWSQGTVPAAGMPDDSAISDLRDPFVLTVDGHRYAVQGAGAKAGPPSVLVYGCDDLERWEPLGVLLAGDDPVAAAVAPADIWECPNLFRLGQRWVLVVSLWRDAPNPTGLYALHGTRYLVGDLTVGPAGPRFTPTSGGLLDDGPCFYAPQVAVVDDRVVLWAWAWELGRSDAEIAAAGWAGSLTFARELSLDGDVVVSRPVPELTLLRGRSVEITSGATLPGQQVDVELPVDAGQAELALRSATGDQVVASWDVVPSGVQPSRVLLDGSMVEVFPGGARAVTTRGYPAPGQSWVLRWSGVGRARAWVLSR